jgi:DHA1 family bicyclomycin/chloramphenicol resistance-like MFS transporter
MTAHAAARVPVGLAALLAALSILSPFSIDTFFPALRAMQADFGVGPLEIQQTLTAYMIPYALMSLVHGPLSDALGRRPVVLWGLAGYTLASLACMLAPGFWTLLVFRGLQGMTAGAGLAVGRAIVRDLYDGPAAQRLMNTVTMFFSIAPALAPVIGGWIYVGYGWRAVFALLVLLGAVVWLAARQLLPESHPPERRAPLHAASMVATSWRILRDREFLLLALAASANFSAVLAYVGSAPAIVLDAWGLGETQFAALFVPVIGGFLLGAILSSRMAGRLARRRQLALGFGCTLAGSLGTVALQLLLDRPPLIAQQAMLTLTTLGVQFVVPLVQLRLLDLHPAARGSVVSLSTFVSLMFGTLVLGVVAPALGGSLVALGTGSALAPLATLLLWRLAQRSAARRDGAQ